MLNENWVIIVMVAGFSIHNVVWLDSSGQVLQHCLTKWGFKQCIFQVNLIIVSMDLP